MRKIINPNIIAFKGEIMKSWSEVLSRIKDRCKDKSKPYHKKGIKTYLTKENLKYLWFRDKAYLMERPSIDRLDSQNNYTLENCRYIELSENVGKDCRGENNYYHRLTWKKVKEIRKKYIPRIVTQKHLAKEYNVSTATVQAVVENKTWKPEYEILIPKIDKCHIGVTLVSTTPKREPELLTFMLNLILNRKELIEFKNN